MLRRITLSPLFNRKLLIFLTLAIGLVIGLFQMSTDTVAASPGGPSLGNHTVYVSSPEGKILKVVTSGNSASVSLVFAGPAGFSPKSMTFGPDGNLWVASGDEIWTVDPDTGIATGDPCYIPIAPTDPTGIGDVRFLAGVPYFTASNGVWRFEEANCGMPKQVVSKSSYSPGGIVFSLTGRLLFLDTGGSLYRSSPPFTTSPLTSSTLIKGGLGSVVAVGAAGTLGFPNTSTTYVTGGGAIKVLSCPNGSSSCSVSSTVSFGSDSVRDLEVNLGGQLLVASLANGSKPKLWVVDGGSKTLLVDLSKEKGATEISNIWGVAIPPTSYTPTGTTVGPLTKRFNCGNSLVEVSGASNPTVDCQMALPEEENDEFLENGITASCVSYDWNNGFCTHMVVGPNGVQKTVLVTYVRKAEPLAVNPLMISDYKFVTIIDYYQLGSLDPTDPSRRSGGSTVVVADEGIDAPATFVAYRPSLSFDGMNPAPVTGGTLPIRIDFNQNCDSGQTLRLTVVCNATDSNNLNTSIVPISNGNTNFENFFRCGSGWYYNLDLDASGVPRASVVGKKAATCAISGWGNVGKPTDLAYFYRP